MINPFVAEEGFDGNRVSLRLSDADSGINFSNIRLLENGEKIDSVELDVRSNTVYINKGILKNNTLIVSDMAGNELKVTVDFYDSRE